MKPQLLLILFLLLMQSCIEEIDLQLPEYTSQIGVNCILVASETPKVFVYETLPIEDTSGTRLITEAEVVISRDDSFEYAFKLSVDSTYYYSDEPVQVNHDYLLTVSYSDREYSGITSVQEAVGAVTAKFQHGNYLDEYGEELTHMKIDFDDIEDEDNYYQMYISSDALTESEYIYGIPHFSNISDPVLVEESLLEYEPAGFIFSDQQFEDGSVSIELFGRLDMQNGEPTPTKLVLRVISEEQYQFQRSWIVHAYNQNNASHVDVLDDLDPYRVYFNESAVPLYSNISGGVGIFGGYSESTVNFIQIEP